jgi:hypothetical protein
MPPESVPSRYSLWTDRITSAVDSQLQAKGWQKVLSGGDASVAAFGLTHNERTDGYADDYGGKPTYRQPDC